METGSSGQSVEWRNPDSGNYGYVTPERAFKNDQGQYCREYTQTVIVGGKQEKAYGKACRKPDGQWEIVKFSNTSSLRSGVSQRSNPQK